jgi:[protein-PII] uridylyltransferase
MSAWKTRLLVELYERTRAHFRRGPDLAGADRSSLVARRRHRLGELLGESVAEGSALAVWLAGLPDRYLAALEPRLLARHVALSRGRGRRAAAIDVSHHPRKGVSELLIAAGDAPGLLARITGVLLASRVDIVGASVFSRRGAAGNAAEALDVFLVRDRLGRAIARDDARWPRLSDDLEAVLGGQVDVDELVARRQEKSGPFARKLPAVATEIEIDNAVAEDFTVLDVYTQDRPGVLFAITHALSDLGLDIHLSKVATEAARVADVFYVRDPERGKITDAARLAAIRGALRAALAEA